MAESQLGKPVEVEIDAVVIGAGLSGIAAAIHLARSGFRVICIEQRREIANILGESLDWSAPELFAQLGLPMDDLIATEAATWKRHITVAGAHCKRQEYLPGPWLAESPWNVEVRTLHLDRDRTDARLRETARRFGVMTLNERVADFAVLDESNARARRILGLRTAQGTFVRASWFIDASGSDASLLGRRFDLGSAVYGPRNVAIWSRVATDEWVEGTTLYMISPPGAYMEWIWEIPIRPGISSIGYVAPGSAVKTQRSTGLTSQGILARQCRSFPRLREMVDQTGISAVATTTFLCRTYGGVCGTNWIIIGEAASQSDPIAGNGVTAALRHAEEASALIRQYRHRGTIPPLARATYNLRVTSVGRYFNSLIEKLFYQPALRDRLGLPSTARVYTVPAWLMNLIYTRSRPRTLMRTLAISFAMGALRAITWTAYQGGALLDRRAVSRSHRQTFSGEEQLYAL
jgi:flavin-dependent dehydrogenase